MCPSEISTHSIAPRSQQLLSPSHLCLHRHPIRIALFALFKPAYMNSSSIAYSIFQHSAESKASIDLE